MRYLFFLIGSFLTCSAFSQGLLPKDFGLEAPAVNCTPVKDQALSSTCWSFASLSFLESELIKKGNGVFDLSEMFIARYSLIRKIDRHLELKGSNYFTPGGQFHDVIWVIKNHGIVPESAYSGKLLEFFPHNHAKLDTLLGKFVKELVANGITEMSIQQQEFVDSLLDDHLGKVPGEFLYNGTVYTPFSFRERVIDLDWDDYVEITSYSHHPYYSSFVLEDKYNWTGDHYYNVPVNDFLDITKNALDNGFSVGWDGDAEDKDFHFYEGLAYLKDVHSGYTEQRQKDFESGLTTLNHLMQIVRHVKDNRGRSWFYIKNSWGDSFNTLKGFMFMREDYFNLRTVAIIVNKNAIPPAIRSKLNF